MIYTKTGASGKLLYPARNRPLMLWLSLESGVGREVREAQRGEGTGKDHRNVTLHATAAGEAAAGTI